MPKFQGTVDICSFSAASRHLINVSGISDTKAYHTRINKRIEELEQEVRKIHEEISALRTCRNAAFAVSRLPVEIVTRIFHLVSKFYTGTDILHVSHVCRRWRSIALDRPQYFADLQRRIVTKEPLTATMIRMSGNAPLTYSWTGSQSYFNKPLNLEALEEAVSSGVGRFKSFVCWRNQGDKFEAPNPADRLQITSRDDKRAREPEQTLADAFDHWFREGEQSYARILEKLSIMNVVVDGYYDAATKLPDLSVLEKGHILEDALRTSNRLFTGGAPALRDLTLSYVGVPWEYLPLVSTLVRLRLLDDSRSWNFRPTVPHFIESLKEMPQLETVELHNFLPFCVPGFEDPGKVFIFPQTLKTLKITDNRKQLSYFLKSAQILDHVSVEVALFQSKVDEADIRGVFADLKVAIGGNRSRSGVMKLVDRSGVCFELSYGNVDAPQGGQGPKMRGCIGSVTVRCGFRWMKGLTPDENRHILAQHIDISCLQVLRLASIDMRNDNNAWSIYSRLPTLNTLILDDTHLGSFLDHLEPEGTAPPPTAGDAPVSRSHPGLCPFPALTKLTSAPPPRLKYVGRWAYGLGKLTALKTQDRKDCTPRFVEILNARKKLGSPLRSVDFALWEISEEGAKQLQKSVPGLVVSRSPVEGDLAKDTRWM